MQRVGPYEVVEEIGRGGMGVVLRARAGRDGREVALKVVLAAAAADADALARFRVEVEAASRLRHANLVSVLDAGEVDGRPYLVMELVRGESLRARLRRAGPPPARDAAALVEKLARALHVAHGAGVVHRDVKPENVLLDERGEPRLIDFGLACIVGGQRLTATGTLLGTPAYMAPELADGARHRVGPWTDVYGLGAVLYELLAGRPPFEGTSHIALVNAVLTREPTPPGVVRGGVDPALEALCLRCLKKEPAERFVSAVALADALARLRRPVVRPPAGRAAPALAVTAVAIALAGLAAGLLLGRSGRPDPVAPPPDGVAVVTTPRTDVAPSPAVEPPPDDARQAQGRALLAAGRVQEALDLARRWTAEDPRDGRAPLLRARALAAVQNVEKALEVVAAALDRLPPGADRDAAAALRERLAVAARWRSIRAAEPAAAQVACAAWMDEEPERIEPALLYHALLLEGGRFAEAAAVSGRLVERHPGDPRAWLARSDQECLRGRPLEERDLARALADAERALELAPELGAAHAQRAVALALLRRVEEARASAGRAVELAPRDGSGWYALGLALMGAPDARAPAREALLRAVGLLQPRDARTGPALDLVQLIDEEQPELEADARRRHDAALARAGATGDPAEVLAALDEAVLLDPRSPAARARRAYARLGRGDGRDIAAALEDLEVALAYDPTSSSALRVQRAVVLIELSHEERARAIFEELLDAARDDPLLEAVVRTYLGDDARAEALLDRVLEGDPEETDALTLRGHLRAMRGDRAGADEDLERARALFAAEGQAQALEVLRLEREGLAAGRCDRDHPHRPLR